MNSKAQQIIIIVIIGLICICAGIWIGKRPSSGPDSTQSTDLKRPVSVQTATTIPDADTQKEPVVTTEQKPDGSTDVKVELVAVQKSKKIEKAKIVEATSPNPVDLREHKVKDSRYKCTLDGEIKGQAEKKSFFSWNSKVQLYAFTKIEWDTIVLENDGERVVEKRTFSKSQSSFLILPLEFGLSQNSAKTIQAIAAYIAKFAIASGEVNTAGIAIATITVAEALKDDKLMKLPVAGEAVKSWLEEKAKGTPEAKFIHGGQKMLGKIERRTVFVTWEKGKLIDVRAEDGGVLTDEDKSLASKVAAFADFKVLPDQKKKPGESWDISAKDISEFYYPDGTDGAIVEGWLRLARAADARNEKELVVNIKGAGNMSYKGEKVESDSEIKQIVAEMACKDAPVKNQYLRKFTIDAAIEYRKVSETYWLCVVDKCIGRPVVRTEYNCVQVEE